MELSAMLIWIKLIAASAVTYYVWKDSAENNVPYRNAWICVTFVFFPVIILYFYYKHHLKTKKNTSSLWQREMELRCKHEEQQRKIKEEMRAWENARKEEMALNKITEEELALAEQKRAEAKAARMKELEEERKLQEELIAKQMHITK